MPEIKSNISREEYVAIARKAARQDTTSPINQKEWTDKKPLDRRSCDHADPARTEET